MKRSTRLVAAVVVGLNLSGAAYAQALNLGSGLGGSVFNGAGSLSGSTSAGIGGGFAGASTNHAATVGTGGNAGTGIAGHNPGLPGGFGGHAGASAHGSIGFGHTPFGGHPHSGKGFFDKKPGFHHTGRFPPFHFPHKKDFHFPHKPFPPDTNGSPPPPPPDNGPDEEGEVRQPGQFLAFDGRCDDPSRDQFVPPHLRTCEKVRAPGE